MVKKVLVAVDGSEGNKTAVDAGFEFAKVFGASVTAICVFDIGTYGVVGGQPLSTGTAQEFIDSTFDAALAYFREKAAESGLECNVRTISGRPAEAIIAESANYDLVVTGTMGRTGLKRALMGSVAETVVRLAHCPVLVVRSD